MEINNKSVYYPPGGILIWIVIYLELITFGIAIIALTFYGATERAQFHLDSQLLNRNIAAVNTIFLLSSGFFAVKAVHFFKNKMFEKSARYYLSAIFSGFGFLIFKLVEYYDKLEMGHDMGQSTFFMFYWLLTGFHWIHVLVGIVILLSVRRSVLKKKNEAALEDIEAGTTYWHMCDLIWLLLFPILYLLF